MDFPSDDTVIEKMQERINHRIFGYEAVSNSYYESIVKWFGENH